MKAKRPPRASPSAGRAVQGRYRKKVRALLNADDLPGLLKLAETGRTPKDADLIGKERSSFPKNYGSAMQEMQAAHAGLSALCSPSQWGPPAEYQRLHRQWCRAANVINFASDSRWCEYCGRGFVLQTGHEATYCADACKRAAYDDERKPRIGLGRLKKIKVPELEWEAHRNGCALCSTQKGVRGKLCKEGQTLLNRVK